jgi:hypothetical protein
MSKKLKRTKIFPPHIKPVHVGEYEASMFHRMTGGWKRWWNGEWWSRAYSDFGLEIHKESHKLLKAPYQHIRWRGLAKKPE